MKRSALLLAFVLTAFPLIGPPAFAAVKKPQRVDRIAPTPRPRNEPAAAPEPVIDLSHALPGAALAHLPSSAEQLHSLSSQLASGKPKLDSAKQKSDALASQAAALKKKLIDTAARIESLEREQIQAAAQIAALEIQDRQLSAGFARDRVSVTRLIALLERLQHDMPPALVMRPDDALGAVRGAMLVGASLPPVYAQAAALARRIEALKRTRAQLAARRAEALATSSDLTKARAELDVLLAAKEQEADSAAQDYGSLKNSLDVMAQQAAGFQALLTRIATLRRADTSAGSGVVTVTAENRGSFAGDFSLLPPVVGTFLPSGLAPNGSSDPGVTYVTRPLAQVIAPVDGKVLYAGPYHKSGQVLILEISTGYDLVLAGLGRVTVRPNDELLAGEPVGVMPASDSGSDGDNRLYFELRRNGHGLSPAPFISLELRKAKKT